MFKRNQNDNLPIINCKIQKLDNINYLFGFNQMINEATRLTPTSANYIATTKLIFSIPRILKLPLVVSIWFFSPESLRKIKKNTTIY